MRASPRIRRITLAVALAALAVAPVAARSADVTPISGSFADGAGGWTSSAACAPLCTVTNAVDPSSGAGSPGSATVIYTTLAGLLGGLASGTSTWMSPTFPWPGPAPANVTLSLARKAAIGGLLTVGGSASARVQLRDLTTGTTTTVLSQAISTADAAFTTDALAIDPALFAQAHSYRLLLTTNLSAAALLSNIRVSYDDIALVATLVADSAATGTPGGPGGTGDPGDPAPGSAPPASGGGRAVLRLLAPRVVPFTPGQRVTLRVRATRAGAVVPRLLVTLRAGGTMRRVSTGRDGYASFAMKRSDRSPIRITWRAGTARAITWARPGKPAGAA